MFTMKLYVISKILLTIFILHDICNYPDLTSAAQRFFSMRDGYHNVGNVFRNASVASVTHCAKKCLNNIDCNVYNVGPSVAGRLVCQIVQSTADEVAMAIQQAGWTMYDGKLNRSFADVYVWYF